MTWENWEKRICANCGSYFTALKSSSKQYCCGSCRREGSAKRNAETRHNRELLHKQCPECGKEFEARDRRSKYCSRECANKANAERARRSYTPKPKTEKAPKKLSNWERCECKRKRSCIYSGKVSGILCCDYAFITGKIRGGYPDECKHYTPRSGLTDKDAPRVYKKKCPHCGKVFETNKKRQKYCSKECQGLANVERNRTRRRKNRKETEK